MEQSVAQLSVLLDDLAAPPVPPSNRDYENRLVEVRLGMASSLFTALRHKHPATAAHSLRVALGCSSWAFALGSDSEQRDILEVAALLHDIGKIGVPDQLLLKPGMLDEDETRLVDQFRLAGLDILANCCPSQSIVEIIRHSAGWYDGSRPNYPLVGADIPPGARMLAIVDAFDSMTSDQVHRPAVSRERALHELFRHAGSQFDPDFVTSFSGFRITTQLHGKVIGHWLQSLDPQQSNRFWRNLPVSAATGAPMSHDAVFRQKMLDNMHDAVVFVDRTMQIIQWNHGAERLTGIAASTVLNRAWSPSLIGLRDEKSGGGCPIQYCIGSGVQSLRRMVVVSRNNRPIAVDVHTVPVIGQDGTMHGAAMLLHDASPETTLEERCQNLHEKATKDPLTHVANRAEFDRAHELFIQAHLDRRLPCSLIMCDIDHFKSINDTYGHQQGDEVLKLFGRLLKSECRPGDLVARYGGEEFVLLCADCNNAAAARRAEQLRQTIADLPQPALNDNPITASFGVTEIQPGDTPNSMLRRADRALLEAKRMGRNMVIQLGGGLGDAFDSGCEPPAVELAPSTEVFLEKALETAVPLNIAVEKLRGFVVDHHAEVLSIKADRIALQIEAQAKRPGRRRADRPVPFLVELVLSEQRVAATSVDGRPTGYVSRTQVQVTVRLKRARDRKNSDATNQASSILTAIKSYLMATEHNGPIDANTSRRTVNVLSPWLKLRG